jgi:hypothetical protein
MDRDNTLIKAVSISCGSLFYSDMLVILELFWYFLDRNI